MASTTIDIAFLSDIRDIEKNDPLERWVGYIAVRRRSKDEESALGLYSREMLDHIYKQMILCIPALVIANQHLEFVAELVIGARYLSNKSLYVIDKDAKTKNGFISRKASSAGRIDLALHIAFKMPKQAGTLRWDPGWVSTLIHEITHAGLVHLGVKGHDNDFMVLWWFLLIIVETNKVFPDYKKELINVCQRLCMDKYGVDADAFLKAAMMFIQKLKSHASDVSCLECWANYDSGDLATHKVRDKFRTGLSWIEFWHDSEQNRAGDSYPRPGR